MKSKTSTSLITGWIMMILSMSAPAADVTITVLGKVVAKPCTVSTRSAFVDLGDLYTFSLVSAGSTSAWHTVILDLTDCPVGTSQITATFSGTTDSTGFYKNQGTAGNLQLELHDDKGGLMSSGTSKKLQVNDATMSVSFPLQVRARSVRGGTTQGTIQSVINVTYTYA
ncbi:MAG: Protein FimG [Candidatus Erwinia impunctatus]|nr:Protein FimG [Culicoides impunctatus]